MASIFYAFHKVHFHFLSLSKSHTHKDTACQRTLLEMLNTPHIQILSFSNNYAAPYGATKYILHFLFTQHYPPPPNPDVWKQHPQKYVLNIICNI